MNNISEITTSEGTVKPTFVLVHAAWQGPYAWTSVKELLLQAGFGVELVQLPAHGLDKTNPGSLHMESYINYVSGIIQSMEKKVILAGHSLAGMIISGVAEKIPDLIEKLVYIAAYVPESGQSAYAISMLDSQSLLGASLLLSEDQTQFDVKQDDILNIFCQDGTAVDQQRILDNYRPEPAAPFSEPVMLTAENFAKVPKYYIETLQDHGIGNILQKRMIEAAGITDTFAINTGHTPSLSNPREVASILARFASL